MSDYEKYEKNFLDKIRNLDEKYINSQDIFYLNGLAIKMQNTPKIERSGDLNEMFQKIKRDMKQIKEKRFSWNQKQANNIKKVFTPFAKRLKNTLYLKFGNLDFLREEFTHENILSYISVDYGKVGGTSNYDEVIRCASILLELFYNQYLLRDFLFKPIIPSKACHLLDPIFRQKIRIQNQKDKFIQEKYFSREFNLLQFIFICIKQWFPLVGWRWTGGQQYAHLYTAKIILIMFEFGLVEKSNLIKILNEVYLMSEIMQNLENYIYYDKDKIVQSYFDEQKQYCTEIREKIAYILLHIILQYLDSDITNRMNFFPVKILTLKISKSSFIMQNYNQKKIDEIFMKSYLSKRKLYTYFSYILITYLARYKKTNDQEENIIRSNTLSDILSKLFIFISDLNGDIFKLSLKQMMPQNFPFYYLKDQNEVEERFFKCSEMCQEEFKIMRNMGDDEMKRNGRLFLETVKNIFADLEFAFEIDQNQAVDQKQSQMIMKKNIEQLNDESTRKLVATLHQIPNYILSILNYIPEENFYQTKELQQFRQDILTQGFILLRKICQLNQSAQIQIFSGINFDQFKNIYSQNVIAMQSFIRDVIIRNQNLLMVEKNIKLLNLIFETYIEKFQLFEQNLDEFLNSKNYNDFQEQNLISIFFFNDIFGEMLEQFSQSRSKFELLIAQKLYQIIPKIVNIFVNNTLNFNQENFNGFIQKFNNLNEFLYLIGDWKTFSDSKKKTCILIILNSFLNLFYRSTTRFFTDEVYNQIQGIFQSEDFQKLKNIMKFEGSLIVIKNYMRIFSIFIIFPNNNLLNNRENYFHIKKKQYDIQETLIGEQMFKVNFYQNLIDLGIEALQNLKRNQTSKENHLFFLCNYFPIIFKIFSGLTSLFIFSEYKEYQKNFQLIMLKVNEFQSLISEYKLYQINFEKNPKKQEYAKYKHQQQDNEFVNHFLNKINNEEIKYLYNEYKNGPLYEPRRIGYNLLIRISEVYSNNFQHKFYHLKKYIRFDSRNTKQEIFITMDKSLRFNTLYRQQNIKKITKQEKKRYYDYNEPKEVIKYIIRLYKIQKTFFFQYPDENPCFVILKTVDILKNNIELFIEYFLYEINEMDLTFEGNNIKNNLLYNKKYITLIMMMDNLIKTSDQYRKTFYEILIEKNKNNENTHIKPFEAFKKIWDLHTIYFQFSLFKPFMDKNWAEIFTIYYLLSNFIQNLCEDNYINFKIWFKTQQNSEENNQTLFQFYFSLFKIAFKNSSVHKNNSPFLLLSDKSESYYLLNRITEGMTEFFNGTFVESQLEIYRFKTNMWVGIILREVYDMNSLFYELKWNGLNYILGLVEGQNFEIINYLAIRFPVNKLYKQIIFLIKALLCRFEILKNINYSKKNIFLTKENLDNFSIVSLEQIMNVYYKHEELFSDHIVLENAIKIYQLMRKISFFVVKFENFISEKNENVISVYKNNFGEKSKEDIEEAAIWEFLNTIIISIEIQFGNSINNEEENQEDEEKDEEDEEKQEVSLKLIYFKMLPKCYFMTIGIKDKFLENLNVDSIDDKHEQFFDNITQFDIQIQNLQNLFKISKILYYISTEESFQIYKIFLYIFAFLLNILLLVFWKRETKELDNYSGNAEIAVLVISLINIIVSGISLFLWFVLKYSTLRKINWEKYYLLNPKDKKIPFYIKVEINFYSSILIVADFQSFFFHLIFSILGLTISPFFYTLLLLLIVHLNKLIYNIVLSFMLNLKKLLMTFILILVALNCFSYLLAEKFRNRFSDGDIGEQNLIVCDTYFRCFVNIINLGLRGGGGITDFMIHQGNVDTYGFIGKFFYDVFFFIIINLIFLGIFFGIIVDSFQAYKNIITKREKDLKSTCFICGLNSPDLEKKGIDFNEHRNFHDFWKYFYYLMYLQWKPKNYYDGVENYISQLVDENIDDWMPKNTTQRLEDLDDF